MTDALADLGYTAVEMAEAAGGNKVLQSDACIDLPITGFAENATVSNGQLQAGTSVLTNPFAVDTLATRIRELISG